MTDYENGKRYCSIPIAMHSHRVCIQTSEQRPCIRWREVGSVTRTYIRITYTIIYTCVYMVGYWVRFTQDILYGGWW